jgi:amino acid transporter
MTDVSAPKSNELGAESFGYKQELKRALGVPDLIILGLSMAVPISVCAVYGYIIGVANGSIALVYLIAGIGVIFTGNSYARMSEAFPLAGGAYAFVSRGMNKVVGFLIGWAMVGMYIVLLPLLYIFCALALYAIFPNIPTYVWMLSFIIINTAFNYRGIEVTRQILKYILFGQFIIYGWIMVAGIMAIARGVNGLEFTLAPVYNTANFSLGAIMMGVSIAVFNFGGPDILTTLGEETKGGIKILGRGVLLTFAVLGILYFVLVYVAALAWPNYTAHTSADIAFYEIVAVIGGSRLKLVFSLTVVLTIFGCCIGVQTCSSRVLYAMGRDHMLPKIFSKVHPRYQSPYVGILVIGVVAVLLCLVFPGKAEVMTSIVNFGMLIVWSMVNLTTFSYYILGRRSRNYLRDLLCPMIGLLLVGYAFISLNFDAKIAGLIWLAIGAIFMLYLIYVKKAEISFSSDSGI